MSFHPPGDCPVCGEPVPAGRKSCAHCGSDERSGWSDETAQDALDLPGEDFNYRDFVEKEFGAGGCRHPAGNALVDRRPGHGRGACLGVCRRPFLKCRVLATLTGRRDVIAGMTRFVFVFILTAFLARASERRSHSSAGGLTRTCVLYIPAGLDAQTPAPLVLVLHGAGAAAGAADGKIHAFRRHSRPRAVHRRLSRRY